MARIQPDNLESLSDQNLESIYHELYYQIKPSEILKMPYLERKRVIKDETLNIERMKKVSSILGGRGVRGNQEKIVECDNLLSYNNDGV